jgi:hypothetical protein
VKNSVNDRLGPVPGGTFAPRWRVIIKRDFAQVRVFPPDKAGARATVLVLEHGGGSLYHGGGGSEYVCVESGRLE